MARDLLKDTDFAPDFYVRLEITPSASQEEITGAYRKRAKETHPDLNPERENAEAEFVAVNRAYEWLKEPAKRSLYDAELSLRYSPDRRGASQSGGSSASARSSAFSGNDAFYAAWEEAARNTRHEWPEYTVEELARYKAASARIAQNQAVSGDLSTVFNFAAKNRSPRLALGHEHKAAAQIAPPVRAIEDGSKEKEKPRFSASGVPLIGRRNDKI